MRKEFAVLSVLVIAAVLFAGYYIRNDGAPESSNAPSVTIRIATGDESGIYSAFGEALANLPEDRLKMTFTVIPSGGSADNIHMLRNGRADIAFVQNDIMTYAYNGTNLFSTEEPFGDLYAIAGLYPEACQIVARRDITGVADLRGRRVSIGAEGSGTELNALQILDSYNIGYADINVHHLGFSASVDAFREGKIDAFFCTAGVPTPAVSELAKDGDVRLLGIGNARARFIISQYPYYVRQIILEGAYPDVGEVVETIAVKAALAASGRLGEETVLEIMKIIFENAQEITKDMPDVSLSREFAIEGLPIPLHPGAEKFFFAE